MRHDSTAPAGEPLASADQPAAAPTSGATEHTSPPGAPDAAGLDVQVPMLEEPTHLPGRRPANFSPLSFYALARVPRTDMPIDDDALWLHEERCPKITPTGLRLGGQVFFHPALETLIDPRGGVRMPKLAIRYDRALLARGVLDEVRVYEIDDTGAYREHCRCQPREQVLREIDLNRVLREREHYATVLLKKVNRAHEHRITLQHGQDAVQRLRDEQAARARRQRRAAHDPIVATPIVPRNPVLTARQKAEEHSRTLGQHLTQSTAPAPTDGSDDESVGVGPIAAPTPAKPATGDTGAEIVALQGRRSHSRRRGRKAAPVPPATQPADSQHERPDGAPLSAETIAPGPDAPHGSAPELRARPDATSTLAALLRGTTGFLTNSDED